VEAKPLMEYATKLLVFHLLELMLNPHGIFDKPTLKFWETAFKQGKNIDESLKLYNQNTVYREKELYNRSRKSASYFAPKNKK
jgi:hypothetical protein